MEQILKLKPNLSEATKRTYSQTYKRVVTYFNRSLDDVSVDEICNAIDNMIGKGDNINTVKAFLNMCILFYQSTGTDESVLINKRNSLNMVLNKHVKQRKEEKASMLVDYETLIENMNCEYDAGNLRNYIVQYLFIHYALRNKDINLKIIPVSKYATDTSINYLVANVWIQKEWVIKLVINNYKTASTYGQKVIIINDKIFVKATRNFVKGKTWLLTDKDKPMLDISLATRIQHLTYNRNTESNYFKSAVNWANTQPNTTHLLKKFSKSRGTDINTILNSYDMDEESI
jgi:hypothetical protein